VTQRGGFAGQHQERRLKGVLGVVDITQDPLAHVQHERAMPNYQGGESRFIPFRNETTQEGGVADSVRFGRRH
jgi:hypothetical protein